MPYDADTTVTAKRLAAHLLNTGQVVVDSGMADHVEKILNESDELEEYRSCRSNHGYGRLVYWIGFDNTPDNLTDHNTLGHWQSYGMPRASAII